MHINGGNGIDYPPTFAGHAHTYPGYAAFMPLNYFVHLATLIIEGVFGRHPDLRFVFADGGSDDGTRELLDAWASDDPRLRVYSNPRRTVPSGLNVALASDVVLAARSATFTQVFARIGLIPDAACERESEWMRQLIEFDPAAKILENRLAAPLAWPDRG